MNTGSAAASIVLVHGGFVDGSGWRPLYDLLTKDGYHVAVVQNPTLSLQGDAAATRLIIDAQDGPVVLVGHSWGGAVISEAGTHPNVVAVLGEQVVDGSPAGSVDESAVDQHDGCRC